MCTILKSTVYHLANTVANTVDQINQPNKQQKREQNQQSVSYCFVDIEIMHAKSIAEI